MAADCDVLIAGAGLSGAVVARRLAEDFGLRCLVVERRDHVGGLCHDGTDAQGVLLPSCGPHWFRTDSDRVRTYLSRFTGWHPVEYRVLAWARGHAWSFPINLRTFEQYLGRPSTPAGMQAQLDAWRQPIESPANSEEYVLSRVGRPFFELFYEGYTRKQWGREARDLLPSACGRIPIRTDRDDRYVPHSFQAMPARGYTRMFERLLDHPGIELRLSASLHEARGQVRHRHLVYTGPVDEFFGHADGPLPWRSLRWERQTFRAGFVQPAMQVNFPDQHEYTRILEPKHATGQRLPYTTILREYPVPHGPGQDPFYAVPAPDAMALHRRYQERAAATPGVTFLGRPAQYRNLDMDQVVLGALEAADRLGPALAKDGPIVVRRSGKAPVPPPLRRRRDPLEPPAAVDVEVVVARYSEAVDWVRNVPSSARILVYDKGGDLDPRRLPFARVQRLPNVGHEAHTYLHHLVDRYDDLAPVTFFCQGHPFDHAFDLHDVLRDVAAGRQRVEGFRWLGFIIDQDDPQGRLFVSWSRNRDGRPLRIDQFHEALFGTPAPGAIPFLLGGQFAVTAEQVRTRSRDFYRKALDLSREFPDAAHCLERLWDRVFGARGIDPALLEAGMPRDLRSIRPRRS